MKELLIVLLLWACMDSSRALYNYLGRMPVESMSYQRCTIPFYGKDVIQHLTASLSKIAAMKQDFEFVPSMDKSKKVFTLPSWNTEKTKPAWALGHWPHVVSAKPQDIKSECASMGGKLPTGSADPQSYLASLLKTANLTTQIMDAYWTGEKLYYFNGGSAAKLAPIKETSGSLISNALEEVIARHDSIYVLTPSTKTFSALSKSDWEVETQSLCMVPANRFSKFFLSPTDFKVKSAKIVRKLNMLYETLESYLDRIRLTTLDLSQSNAGSEIEGYPTIIGELQEFMTVVETCFGLQQCDLFDKDILATLDSLLENIGYSLTRIELGFIVTNEGSCEISNAKKLSCLCTAFEKKWMKLIFEPTTVSKLILAFDHVIYEVEGTKPITTTCMYQSHKRYYVLTEECCQLVIAANTKAVYHCPSYVIENYSGVTYDNRLLRIDATEKVTVNKQCDQISDTKTIVGADSLMLSSCNLEILSKIGRHIFKGAQNFFVEKSIGKNEEKLTTKEIIIFASLGTLGFIVLAMTAGIVFYCSKKSNNVVCLCFKRKGPELEVSPEILPLHSYELRNFENRPAIGYR